MWMDPVKLEGEAVDGLGRSVEEEWKWDADGTGGVGFLAALIGAVLSPPLLLLAHPTTALALPSDDDDDITIRNSQLLLRLLPPLLRAYSSLVQLRNGSLQDPDRG
jgi:hypothetical protein